MALISETIPNLINGVSQQSPSLRLPTQCKEQINGYPTIVQGNKKRPPRLFDAKLNASFTDEVFTHLIDRGTNERYRMYLENGDLRVFDLDTGEEKTVTFPNGKSYLETSSAMPKDAFRAFTNVDFTYIANRNITVAMDGAVTEARAPECLIYVRAGNYGKEFSVTINGSVVARYTTVSTALGAEADFYIGTSWIAEALATGKTTGNTDAGHDIGWANLDENLPAGFSYALYENIIHIWSNDGSDFSLATSDDFNDDNMYGIKDTVSAFSKLPDAGPDGFVVKIANTEANTSDDYYVRFNKDDPDNRFGVWKECPAQGVPYAFDPATLPHALVSKPDGTFEFQRLEWDERVAGDEEVIPNPSMVGLSIQEITFHKNRLVLCADENTLMSRSGDYYNFWRQTATQLLDDDPIDVAPSYDKVSIIRHAIPWNNDLILFSDSTQFSLGSSDLLTPKQVSIDPTTEYLSSGKCRPIVVGRYIYFPAERKDNSVVQEYYVLDEASSSYDANNATNHVPEYLPANIYKMTGSDKENTIVCLSADERDTLYIHNFYFNGKNEKLQASWTKWAVEEGSKVLDIDVIHSELRLVVKYPNGDIAHERVSLDPASTDTGKSYTTLLDRRLTEDQVTLSYDSGADTTTVTLPYEAEEIEVYTTDAAKLQVSNLATNTFTLKGDQTSTSMFIGIPYEFSYAFSPFYVRQREANGASSILTDGMLQLRYLNIVYDSTALFKVDVTPKGRKTYTYTFSGFIDGDPNTQTGKLGTASGTFRVPLMSNSGGLEIVVRNREAFPSKLLSATWVAMFVKRTKSI